MATNADWIITNSRCDAAALAQHRSVFAVSNGVLGLSGHVIGDCGGPWPLTIINGVYDELDMFGQLRASPGPRPWLDERFFDSAGRSPAVAALPDPLHVRIFVGGCEIAFNCGKIVQFEQSLLLRSGVYAYVYDYCDAAGRTTRVESQRFAMLDDVGRVYMRLVITPRDHDAPIRVISGIDGTVRSNLTRERQFEVDERSAEPGGRCGLTVRTLARGHVVRMTVDHHVEDGAPTAVRPVCAADGAYVEYEFAGAAGRRIVLDRAIAIDPNPARECGGPTTGVAGSETRHPTTGVVGSDIRHPTTGVAGSDIRHPTTGVVGSERGGGEPFPDALHANHEAWQALWKRADIQIDGDAEAQRHIRFCLFHLLAAGPRGEAGCVPVKLLTGQYYQGNTFYDTDLYIVPFYTFVVPQIARACVQFRLSGVGHARALAERQGLPGLKFAWQAGPAGEECLGDWYWFTRTNIHINADVAYAMMQYIRATGDVAILDRGGRELLIGVARFFAARARHDAGTDAWTFEDVAGPDEGHCHSRSNFFTNYTAARVLEWAAEVCASGRIDADPAEAAQWRRIAGSMRLLFDPATKIYEQCEGFFTLKPLPPDFLARRTAWFEPVWEYQAMNQPDVLMAMMLFGERFDAEVLRANWECYRDRSLNFSSMSYVVHSIIAARLGDADEAYRNFRISAGMDLDESLTGRGDTHMGLHGTALGGAWLAAVFGLGGVQFPVAGPGEPITLQMNPCLPKHWKRLRFNLFIRGEQLRITVDHGGVEVAAGIDGSLNLPARIAGREVMLTSGKSVRVPLPA